MQRFDWRWICVLLFDQVPQCPFTLFGEGSPAKIDYRKKGTLILTAPLEDLVEDT